MTVRESDVLRWMAQADEASRKEKKPEKKVKWKMAISSWMRTRKTGEWIREAIATTTKRKFAKFTHGAESTKKKPAIVKVDVEELVYQHDVYRPHLDGEKNTRKATFWRGARIWRDL